PNSSTARAYLPCRRHMLLAFALPGFALLRSRFHDDHAPANIGMNDSPKVDQAGALLDVREGSNGRDGSVIHSTISATQAGHTRVLDQSFQGVEAHFCPW